MTIWVILEWPFILGPFLNISQCESFLKNYISFLVYREPFDRNLKVSFCDKIWKQNSNTIFKRFWPRCVSACLLTESDVQYQELYYFRLVFPFVFFKISQLDTVRVTLRNEIFEI